MEQTSFKISNFKLNIFRNLLEQSLIVDNQLMLEFNTEMIKSCSFSNTKSLIKLWTIPLKSLIVLPDNINDDLTLDLNDETPENDIYDFPEFNFYILRGDLFKKFLSVHNTDMVDIEFSLRKINDKYYGSNLIITGKSENNSPLITSFILTTEELLTNKIEDYSQIIKECTPTKGMFEFILLDNQIQEVKRLIKNLHKSSPENTSFLTFKIDSDNKKIIVNDKVFSIEFLISTEIQKEIKFPKEGFEFKMLKSDFIVTGNHTFSFYTDKLSEKVLLGAKYSDAIIWCLATKVNESSLNLDSKIDDLDSTLDNLDVSEYF